MWHWREHLVLRWRSSVLAAVWHLSVGVAVDGPNRTTARPRRRAKGNVGCACSMVC